MLQNGIFVFSMECKKYQYWMDEHVTDCQTQSPVKSGGWGLSQKTRAMVCDPGAAAQQGAREPPIRARCYSDRWHTEVADALWTSCCLWVTCNASRSPADQVGFLGVRMHFAAGSRGVPRGSGGPSSAARCQKPGVFAGMQDGEELTLLACQEPSSGP